MPPRPIISLLTLTFLAPQWSKRQSLKVLLEAMKILRQFKVGQRPKCPVGMPCNYKVTIFEDIILLKQVPPDSIERAAGLLFFNKVSRSHFKKINGKEQ